MPDKFVICDPSIVGSGGHYLGYAEGLLRAARDRGYETHLWANATYRPQAPAFYESRSVFAYDIWGRGTQKDSLAGWREDPEIRGLLRARYGRAGLLWEISKDLPGLAHYGQTFPLRPALMRRLPRVAALRERAETILKSLEWAARAEGREPDSDRALHVRLIRRSIREAARAEATGVAPSAAAPPASLEALGRSGAAAASFAALFAREAAALGLGAGDHVVMPTLAWHELAGLSAALAADARLRAPAYHFVCRRDIYRGYHDEFDAQEWGLHGLRHAFHAFLSEADGVRAAFYTDTEELTRQYDRLDAYRFGTLPVPVAIEPDPDAPEPPELETAATWTVGLAGPAGQPIGATLSTMMARARPAPLETPGLRILAYGDPSLPVERPSGVLARPELAQVLPASGPDWMRRLAETSDAIALTDLEIPGARAALLRTAFEHGRPVILPAGLPEAAAAARIGESVHARFVAARGEILSDSGPDASAHAWRRYYPDGRDLDEPGVLDGDGVAVTGDGMSYAVVRPPQGATHLWLGLPMSVHGRDPEDRPAVTELTAAFRDEGGRTLGPSKILFLTHGPENPEADPHSIMLRLPEGARSAWLALRRYAGPEAYRLGRFHCRWVRAAGDPPVTVGYSTYATGESYAETLGRLGQAVADATGQLAAQAALAPLWPSRPGRPARRARRAITGCYLGDAREEKGFHLLPQAIAEIGADPLYRGRARFRLQAYAPAAAPDVRMLLAVDALDGMDADLVRLLKRPLPPADYNRVLDRSDFVLVPYKRANYTARSSGVFSEAMAAGKPAIVPAGTWMSRVMDEASFAFHSRAIPEDAVEGRLGCAQACQWFVLRDGVSTPARSGQDLSRTSVRIGRDRTLFFQLPKWERASHLWLSFSIRGRHPDLHALCSIAQLRDPDGTPSANSIELSHRVNVLGGTGAARLSVVVPLEPGANRLWIGFYNAFTASDFDLVDPEIVWVRSAAPIAESAFGVKYDETGSPGEDARRVARAVRTLVDTYDSAVESLAEAAPAWRAHHSHATIVDEMLSRAGPSETQSPAGRISARDW